VPSACLSANYGGRRSGSAHSLGLLPAKCRGSRMQLRPGRGGGRGPDAVRCSSSDLGGAWCLVIPGDDVVARYERLFRAGAPECAALPGVV
jgi:hypothetical protein